MTKICSVAGCSNTSSSRGYCNKHYLKWRKFGDPLAGISYSPDRAPGKGKGYINRDGYFCVNRKPKHIDNAEKALGKKLPIGAVVHHADENKLNNANDNLVICPNADYHKLLHARQRAVDAGYPPSYRKCTFCKKYDALDNMRMKSNKTYEHAKCRRAYDNLENPAARAEFFKLIGL